MTPSSPGPFDNRRQAAKERLAQALRDGDNETFVAAIRKANDPAPAMTTERAALAALNAAIEHYRMVVAALDVTDAFGVQRSYAEEDLGHALGLALDAGVRLAPAAAVDVEALRVAVIRAVAATHGVDRPYVEPGSWWEHKAQAVLAILAALPSPAPMLLLDAERLGSLTIHVTDLTAAIEAVVNDGQLPRWIRPRADYELLSNALMGKLRRLREQEAGRG